MKYVLEGTAIITNKGLLFSGNYYSCPLAIRKQWFNPDGTRLGERVPIFFEPFRSEVVYLCQDGIYTCHLLRSLIDPTFDLTSYYDKLQELKLIYRRRQKKIKRVRGNGAAK